MAKYCIYCGEELPDTAQFCPSCGKKQNTEPKQQMVKDEPESDDEIDLLLKYGMINSKPKEEKPEPKIIRIDSPIDELLSESEQKDENDAAMDLIQSYVRNDNMPEKVLEKEKEEKTEEATIPSPEVSHEKSAEVPEEAEISKTEISQMAGTKEELPLDIPKEKDDAGTGLPASQDMAETGEIQGTVKEEPAPAPVTTRHVRKKKDDFVFAEDEDEDDEDFGLIMEEEKKEEAPKLRRHAARRDVTVKKRSISVEEAEDDFNTDINTVSGGGINFDSEKIHADEILEREKRKNAVIEEDDGDRSSLEGRTVNKQKQTKRRQSQRNYNDKKIYEIEHDRSEIDENEDPDYDGYYENVLPVDYDRDVKKNIDWKTIGIVFGFLGFIALFIFIFVTYLI